MRLICVILALIRIASAQDDARRITPFEGRRMALVIGNKSYDWKPLANPEKDARAVAGALSGLGFAQRDIHLVLDARQGELRRKVREFVESVKPGDLAFVYYSGHGVEVRGRNYLLPIDLPADATEGYVQDETVSAQRILEDLGGQGARVRVLILDACRDNPLRAAKSTGGGLAPMEGRGSLIVFATEAGRTASDSPGSANSVFTRYLLDGLRTPGMSLDDSMKRVSRNVARATGERQIPAIYGLLLEDVVLLPGGAAAVAPVVAPVVVAPAPPIVPSGPQRGDVKVNAKDSQRYVWIPAGTFTMGCSASDLECFDEEKPSHDVTISKGFWMGQTPVTVGAYKRYSQAAGKAMPPEKDNFGRLLNAAAGNDSLPVVAVNWEESAGYCGWAGMRLPTEAQWEYAARAGSSAARYGSLDEVAWYADNSGRERIDSTAIWNTDQKNYTQRLFDNGNGPKPVGGKQPNGYGLYDMLGNVWQWTADWYGEKYYQLNERRDPQGPPGGTLRTLRGGSWFNDPRNVRVSVRSRDGPGNRFNGIGLRCVGE